MNTVKHYVNDVEYASIVEVLKEINAAETLGYSQAHYTGTPIYQYMHSVKDAFGESVKVGHIRLFKKAEVIKTATHYISLKNRRAIQENNARVMKILQNNPDLATKFLSEFSK